MADISKITLPNGVTYDIKDTVARNAISTGLKLIYTNNEEPSDELIITLDKNDLNASVDNDTGMIVELNSRTLGVNPITVTINLNNNVTYSNCEFFFGGYNSIKNVYESGTRFIMFLFYDQNKSAWQIYASLGPVTSQTETVQTIIGTQSESTAQWKGIMPQTHVLESGMKFLYVLPQDCSGTISCLFEYADSAPPDYPNFMQETPVYTDESTRLSGDFKAGQTFLLVYFENNKLTLNGQLINERRFYCTSGTTSSGSSEEPVDKNQQLVDLLATMKTGRKYGVHFDDYTVNNSTTGTRLYDAAGMSCLCSTSTYKGTNTFENVGPFAFIEANGYVDAFGDFQVTAIKGLDDDFSRTNADTFCCFVPHYIKVTIDNEGEEIVISDAPFDGCRPESAAIKLDGTLREFIPIPKYTLGRARDPVYQEGELYFSRSGCSTYGTGGYAAGQMLFRQKYGDQVCSFTSMDMDHMRTLFMVAFASTYLPTFFNCHAPGDHKNVVFEASVQETNVERIIVSNSNASNLLVGQTVHIGNPTTIKESYQYNSDYHYFDKAFEVKITNIETYDSYNKAIYVDNGGVKFDTTDATINGTAYSTQITLLPPLTGACDNVQGVCGQNNTKQNKQLEPYLLFGVEFGMGGWQSLGNVFVYSDVADGPADIYVIYDCINILPQIRNPDLSNYTKIGYTKPIANNWSHIAKLGYDPQNPSVRLGIAEGDKYSGTGKTPNPYNNQYAYVVSWEGGGTLSTLGFLFCCYVTSVDRYIQGSYSGAWGPNYITRGSAIGRSARVATGYENA